MAIKLKPAAEKMVRSGHPWVFENSITKQNVRGDSGDLAIIYSVKKNKFLACGLYDPESPIRIKLLHFYQPTVIDSDFFLNKIRDAYCRRKPLLESDTNAYRLIFGENDAFPGLIADVYDNVLVVKLYSTIWLAYFNQIVTHLVAVSKCDVAVLRMSRLLQRAGHLYGLRDGKVLYGKLPSEEVVFKEHGIRFSANVVHGHKTGYFLDHRHNRKRVGELSKNKRVLDVFSYAGGFSVHALVNGAREVISMDISTPALEMAKKNVTLNTSAGLHKAMATDAFKGLKKLRDDGEKFDVIVIDPPSFAKKETEVKKALHHYGELAALGASLVADKGLLVLASCSSRVSSSDFFSAVEGRIYQSGKKFDVMEKTYHDADHPISFPEGAYLKCGYYRVNH